MRFYYEVVVEDADAEGFGGGGLEELVASVRCVAEGLGPTVCLSGCLHGMGTRGGS